MKNQTNIASIQTNSVKSAIDNINFNWADVDPYITDIADDVCLATTPFGDYTIKKFDYPSVCYRLYFNDYAISDYVDDIDSLKSAAIDIYRTKLSKVFNI